MPRSQSTITLRLLPGSEAEGCDMLWQLRANEARGKYDWKQEESSKTKDIIFHREMESSSYALKVPEGRKHFEELC